ncbi:hypothetical protein [Microbulbifer hydrolyticus]|uniref:Uncharacterized protein n=1 Tax=Microbulbifer hydrolyticus TaxID=48074 RepID=A0A6P1T7L8_9GAMM|nr:hypothetical protein [Microbulbifer hydrolyticus]MBB5211534.1 hypothetical protein [Microbulbifer hydrolyticus]QHQ37725.1 hypothetical protein GTQ55_01135 [Microbulbifer hydrolyticus]
MNRIIPALLFFFTVLASGPGYTQDTEGEVITLESTIIGSQEQPKVLYIIPWKQANSLEKIESTLPNAINHTFQHQEYSELQREIKLLQQDDSDA